MLRKIFVLRVLKNQKTILTQQFTPQHKVNNLLATLQIVGRIRENHIKLFVATLQVEEHIGVGGVEIGKAQLTCRLADESIYAALLELKSPKSL